APPADGRRDPCLIEQGKRLDAIEGTALPSLDRKVTRLGQQANELDTKIQAQEKEIQAQGAAQRQIQDSVTKVGFNSDRFWVLLAAVLVFFMQAGFKCLEVGMVGNKFDALQAAQKM